MANSTPRSIPAIFREQAAKLQSRPMVYSKVQGHWSPLTWAQVRERVDNAAAGLIVLGVQPGEVVSLLSENRPEWMLADLAVLSAGAADAPIYATNTPAECAYVVRDSDSKAEHEWNKAREEVKWPNTTGDGPKEAKLKLVAGRWYLKER